MDVDNASVNFHGLMVPEGTPPDVTDILADRVPAIFRDEEVVTKMREAGAPMRIMGQEEVQSLWQREQATLKDLLADLPE